MRAGSPSRAGPADVRRRRAVAVTAALAAALVAVMSIVAGGRATPRPGTLVLRSGAATLARVPLSRYARRGRLDRAAASAAALRALPVSSTATSARARIEYVFDAAAARRALAAVPVTGATVDVPRRPVAASVDAPPVAQREPDDCEATSLSILLGTTGVHADQLTLQSELPRSGPLDATLGVWGDPELGFVGRPEGGGFGVYQRPVMQVAVRHRRTLHDLTGSAPAAIYHRLLAGHAVMVWVGLADGPYAHWRSPSSRPITVNFSEHAIVLTGIDATGSLLVDNPLDASPERWAQARFEASWARLGRRALSA